MKWFYLTLLLFIPLELLAPMSHHLDYKSVEVFDPYKVTIFTDKMSIDFKNKVEVICKEIEVPSDWLVGVMWHESRLNSKTINRIGATGLIQFLPSTAKWLNTTTEKLASMPDTMQLNYVAKYYRHMKGLCKERTDLYLYTFFPSAVLANWTNSRVIKSSNISASTIASLNPGLDLNKDNMITVEEFRKCMEIKIASIQ